MQYSDSGIFGTARKEVVYGAQRNVKRQQNLFYFVERNWNEHM
jgi:hypothetical protein